MRKSNNKVGYENTLGLIVAAIILGAGAGLLFKTCNDVVKTLEEKVGTSYNSSLEEYYNVQDNYSNR